MTLVGENQFFALAAVLLSVVAFSFWAETRRWGQKIGGPLLILVIAMALANLRVIPHVSGLYASIGDVLVPMAIPLLLLRADLKLVFTESGPMLLAFVLAAGATIVGAFVGVYLIDLGSLEPQIAGTLAASYIGGSLNFVATAEAVGIKESAIYLAAFSADSVGAVLFLIVLMTLPAFAFVRRAMPSKFMDESGRSLGEKLLHHEDEQGLYLIWARPPLASRPDNLCAQFLDYIRTGLGERVHTYRHGLFPGCCEFWKKAGCTCRVGFRNRDAVHVYIFCGDWRWSKHQRSVWGRISDVDVHRRDGHRSPGATGSNRSVFET